MADLFETTAKLHFKKHAPLADRLRPQSLNEVYGQSELLGEEGLLKRLWEAEQFISLLMWGPPGSGKTTLARLIAERTQRFWLARSAVSMGVKEVREILAEARKRAGYEQRGTALFLDEIHRFNKAQQDALLHGVEDGTILLIGATTENPSLEVNAALLSRMRVVELKALDRNAQRQILERALQADDGLAGQFQITEEAQEALIDLAVGDARSLLNNLELCALWVQTLQQKLITPEIVKEIASRKPLLFDKAGEEHYNVASALIKSMRGSDPDAAIYWLARMLEGGEDPKFITRRLIIFASEDIGNADPQALPLAVAAGHAIEQIGMPEGFYALSQAVLYLACAPKSNRAGHAYKAAKEEVLRQGALPVPLHIRNAPTEWMKEHGYGKNYQNPHHKDTAQKYLPEPLIGKIFYEPSDHGFEAKLGKRLQLQRARLEASKGQSGSDE